MKDAATASRYGLRGGNGIIQVTTNRGVEGKSRVKFHARAGLKKPTTTPKLLDSYDYATLYNEARINDGIEPLYSSNHLDKYMNARNGIYENPDDKYLFPNVNWYDDYMKDATWQQRYSVSLDGGSKYAKYFVSLGYTHNDGMYNVDKNANSYNTNTSQDAITIRSNVDIDVTSRFKISLDLSGRQDEKNYPGEGNSSGNVFSSVFTTPPNAFPVFQKDLTKEGKPMLGGNKDYQSNIYGLLNNSGYTSNLIRYMAATLSLKHDLDFITPGLAIRGEIAFDSWYQKEIKRHKQFKVFAISQDQEGNPVLNEDGSFKYIETGSNSQMAQNGSFTDNERILNYRLGFDYKRSFNKHDIYTEFLFNQREISQENNRNLPRIYRGFDGRFSYNYDKRYLFDFNIGIMGSEQFLKDDRYGFFPAASIGWVPTQEAFLKDNDILSFLKIRASYGLTGWDDTGGYFLWFQQYGSSSGFRTGPTTIEQKGWNESAFALNNVTWEKIRKLDVGFDARFWKDKVSMSFDYFYEKNKDIMKQPALPYIMGIRFPDFPIGRVQNKGYEFSIAYNDKIGDFSYGISTVFTRADNKIEAMGEEVKPYPYLQRTGLPIDSQWGLVALGLFQSEEEIANSPLQTFTSSVRPGDIKYQDVNGDGVIDEYDEVYLGLNAEPNLQWGVGVDLSWKGLDFSVLLTGQDGGWLNMEGQSMWAFYNNGSVREHHLDRFNPQDPQSWEKATYPRLSLNNNLGNQKSSTFWRIKLRQTRLKHIEIGYNVPISWTKGVVNNLRFYVNAYNLLTWQSSDMIDTEAKNGSYVQYPIQKIINFGVNVTF